jgi:hypothetical protein
MKRSLLNSSFILFLIFSSTPLNFASYSAISFNIPSENDCITATINKNEGVIRIVIMGTSQGEGLLEFKNAKNEVVHSQTIKTWNERTDLDLEETSFVEGRYTVSFSSTSMKCNAEFTFK